MRTFNLKRLKKIAAPLTLAAMIAMSTAIPTLADSYDLVVTGGTLNVSAAAGDATPVTLTGLDQATSFTIPTTVTDPTGTGNGWNVTLTSTALTNGSRVLANGASTIAARPSVGCFEGSTCSVATDGAVVTYPYTIPAAPTTAPTATKAFSAAQATGMGKMTFTPTVDIALLANNTYAGTYTSTLTYAIVSAP